MRPRSRLPAREASANPPTPPGEELRRLGIERGDGSFRWLGTAGEARPGGVPMRPDTPYFIASVTKLYIAAAVLRLHEQGRVGLDEPMTAYLPQRLVAGLHRLDGVDRTGEITVRHLLGHTSGLPDYLEDRPKGGRSLLDRVLRDSDASWQLDDVVGIVRRELTPHFPPRDLGSERVKGRYSDTNFQLLIAIVEAVTGRAFHEVLEEQLLRPLGLRHTYLPGRSEPLEPTPETAAMWHQDRPLEMPLALPAFNDLVSTAGDTLAFLGALVRGDVFDDPATAGLMQERWNQIGYPLSYGLGMMRFRVGRVLAPGWRPVTLVGHSGASGSWAFFCPELDVLLAGTVDQWAGRGLPFRLMAAALRVLHA
jgi:D-alanyl-D-alanine carboxypeptidase